jgi:hypothetical protein
MHDPVAVEVYKALEQLIHDRLDNFGGDGVAVGLSVVVDDLQEIVLGILKHDEDALLLENDFHSVDDVEM